MSNPQRCSSRFDSGFFRHIWAYRNFLIFISAPCLLLPLTLCFEKEPELKNPMRCAYVLAIMVIYWVTEAIPMAITSLVPMVLYPLLQIVPAPVLAAQYVSETNMAIIASILVVKAFEEAELHRRFAFAVISFFGVQPRWLLMGLMLVAWLLSAILQNAMAATLLIPVVLDITKQLRKAIAENVKERAAKEQPLKSITVAVIEMKATERPVVGSAKKEAKRLHRIENMCVLGVAYACSIGGTATFLGSPENLIVADEIDKLYAESGCLDSNPVNFATWMVWGLPGAVIFLPIAWLWLQIFFAGPSYAFFCDRNPSYVKAHKDRLWKIIQAMRDDLSKMGSRQWIVLIHIAVMIILFFTRLMHTNPMIGWELIAPNYVKESTVACLIAISLFAFPIATPKADGKKKFRKPKKAIFWTDEDGGKPFNIVLLIGGGLAATYGAIESGFAQLIADVLFSGIHELSQPVTVVILVTFSVFLTELISNSASVHFMIPVLIDLTERQHRNPMLYLLPTALTSSFAFMFPVATEPNALAYSLTKGLRVVDMICVGFVMNLFGIGIVLLATNTWGDAFFHLYEPAWDVDEHSGNVTCFI